ncbi:MAG: hypothetical protein MZW92_37215 [Comamonadaceae bacterium]|nr:hypothetical protein [Comamonadaceae bacterium]
MTLAMDRLSGWFALAAGLVFLPVSIYSGRYLARYAGHYSLPAFAAVYYALLAAIGLTLTAHDVLSFLIAWELMSVLSYFIVNYEHLNDTNTHAGYLMLAAGEVGALMIAVALLALALHAGATDFAAMRGAGRPGPHLSAAVFLLSFFGFGVKAGLFPSMSWLPRAHPRGGQRFCAALRRDPEPGYLRHRARQRRSAIARRCVAGRDRAAGRRGQRHHRHPLRHDREQSQAHAGAQLHRKHGPRYGGIGRRLRVRRGRAAGARRHGVHRRALSPAQPLALQEPAVPRRRRGGRRGRYARHGRTGRSHPPHALDRRVLSGGRALHRGTASVQRLPQRMAHPADPAAQRGARLCQCGSPSRWRVPWWRSPPDSPSPRSSRRSA